MLRIKRLWEIQKQVFVDALERFDISSGFVWLLPYAKSGSEFLLEDQVHFLLDARDHVSCALVDTLGLSVQREVFRSGLLGFVKPREMVLALQIVCQGFVEAIGLF